MVANGLRQMLLLLALGLLAGCATRGVSVERHYNRAVAETEQRKVLDSTALMAYLETVDSDIAAHTPSAQTLSAADADYAFRAASLLSFYTANRGTVARMQEYVARLEALGAAQRRHYTELYERLMLVRDVDGARRLQEMHPEAGPAVPPLADASAGAPPTFIERDTGGSLTRRSWRGLNDAGIVVVAHPRCHFSANAVAALQSDDELRPLFEHRALYLFPPEGNLGEDLLAEWHTQHPSLVGKVAYAKKEWPMVSEWGTPTFYFLRDGKVVQHVSGWPAEGRRDKVRAALREVGLLP